MNITALKTLPFITYGTTRLGDASIPSQQRVASALELMREGYWFHTSHQYGEAEAILAQAFQQEPQHVPKLMIKIGGDDVAAMRADVLKNTQAMGVSGVEVGQLCPGAAMARELAAGGACYEELERLKEEGLVQRFVLEVFPWTSQTAYQALKAGHLEGRIDALIFYFNPLQRFVSNELWELLQVTGFPWLALRSVGGGDVRTLAKDPSSAWMPYWHERAVEVLPIFEGSGVQDWPEFCVRFAASFSSVQGTISASSRPERIRHLRSLAEKRQPLPHHVLVALMKLQQRWAAEVDAKAEPWTM